MSSRNPLWIYRNIWWMFSDGKMIMEYLFNMLNRHSHDPLDHLILCYNKFWMTCCWKIIQLQKKFFCPYITSKFNLLGLDVMMKAVKWLLHTTNYNFKYKMTTCVCCTAFTAVSAKHILSPTISCIELNLQTAMSRIWLASQTMIT